MEFGHGNRTAWTVPVSVFLVSAGWWENYVDRRSPLRPVKELGRLKDRLKKTRYFTYAFVSVWKMVLFLSCMLLFLHLNGTHVLDLFSRVGEAVGPHNINVTETHHGGGGGGGRGGHALGGGGGFGAGLPDVPGAQLLPDVVNVRSESTTPMYVLLIHVSSAWFAYVFGKFACKICIQGFSFAFPVILAVPATVTLMITACGLRNEDTCYFKVGKGGEGAIH